MRTFDPHLAEIRFGYGLSPLVAPPQDAAAVLAGLTGPDVMVDTFPTEPFPVFRERMVKAQAAQRRRRENRGTAIAEAARKERNKINGEARRAWSAWGMQILLRRTYTETAFRERLATFWADHFTAHGKRGVMRRATTPYIDAVVRPFITGRFADMLQATVMHPVMLDYLDQSRAVGPNSAIAHKRGPGKAAGLNENLAREVLELHTLGVDGPYTQDDVRELAELFTGMTFEAKNGYKFRKDFVEPGAEQVLGQNYEGDQNDKAIRAVLADLAAHPATARHLAWKLAVHFTSDTPDPALIDALEQTYIDTDGSLFALYEILLAHPSAWEPSLNNFKPPIDYMSSAMRSLAPPADALQSMEEKQVRAFFNRPLLAMGQEWERPIGPDGWPEEDENWITPQGLAGRVDWAIQAPATVMGALPDPRDFVDSALGPFANDAVRFAAGAAESRSEAIALVLMAPAFQRR
ncbi:MAG: DUF1800 domain-containing protein [Pseudomonadota bacterium]